MCWRRKIVFERFLNNDDIKSYHANGSVVEVGIVRHNALELVLTIRSKETTQLLIPPAFLLLLPAFLVLKINIIIIAIFILLLFVIIIIIKNIFFASALFGFSCPGKAL